MEPNQNYANIRNGYDANALMRPSSVIVSEIKTINNEMARMCANFNGLCAKIEHCVKNINLYARRADRELFKMFFAAGLAPGQLVRFLGSKDENQIFYCSGMDGGGFYFRPYKTDGKEFYIDVFKHQNVASKIRLVYRGSARARLAGSGMDNHSSEMHDIPGPNFYNRTPDGIETDDAIIEKTIEQESKDALESLEWLKNMTPDGNRRQDENEEFAES